MNVNLFVAPFASSCTIFALLIAFCSLCCGGKIWGGGNGVSTGVLGAGSFVAGGGDGGMAVEEVAVDVVVVVVVEEELAKLRSR